MTYIYTLYPTVRLNSTSDAIDATDQNRLSVVTATNTISGYSAGADTNNDGINTLSKGEQVDVSFFDSDDSVTILSTTYVGDATLNGQTVDYGAHWQGARVILPPVKGHMLQGEDGTLYFVSDDPINDGSVEVSAFIMYDDVTPYSGTLDGLFAEMAKTPDLQALMQSSPPLLKIMIDTVVGFQYEPGETMVVCFAAGTLIDTPDGPRPVQDLAVGDRVATRDNGVQTVRWTGARRLSGTELAAHPHLRPIRIRAGALGAGLPAADLLVSPQHRVMVRSAIAQRMFATTEVLVAARQLTVLNGIEVAQDVDHVDYHHFLLDRHEVVIANGAPAESLFTGPQALKSVGPAARREIVELFPELADPDHLPVAARHLATGHKARKLALRHRRNDRPLVT